MQVRNLELPERHELRKLQQLKEEAGEMTAADERKLRGLQRATEKEILQAADVVCVTCVGAGDLRLNNFRFRQVTPTASFPILLLHISKCIDTTSNFAIEQGFCHMSGCPLIHAIRLLNLFIW